MSNKSPMRVLRDWARKPDPELADEMAALLVSASGADEPWEDWLKRFRKFVNKVEDQANPPKLNNPKGPKNKEELWSYVAHIIDQEGLDYGLTSYDTPEYCNCDVLDPHLAQLWRDYIALAKKITTHVGAK